MGSVKSRTWDRVKGARSRYVVPPALAVAVRRVISRLRARHVVVLACAGVLVYASAWVRVILVGDIWEAAAWNSAYRIGQLVESDRTLLNRADGTGLTPLHHAAINDSRDAAKCLAAMGANMNARSLDDWQTDGGTPLHAAVIFGHARMVELLLDLGAQHNVPDNLVRYPLHWTAVLDRIEIARILLLRGAFAFLKDTCQNNALHLAAAQGNSEIVVLLLRYRRGGVGLDLADPGLYGETALQMAYKHGHDDIVKEMIRIGANPAELRVRLMPLRRRGVWWADWERFNQDMKALRED
jgi:ankyrin repeat protein